MSDNETTVYLYEVYDKNDKIEPTEIELQIEDGASLKVITENVSKALAEHFRIDKFKQETFEPLEELAALVVRGEKDVEAVANKSSLRLVRTK